ncbi:glucose-6-phosphate 1-dehydrogenase [Homoserinimonas aerilata]|uniref:Glucose-6-phosphate 1-dehydrogenase n=1 Tax=Homoserinimonas aerilata TaxID=1162970 RepID=A0A542YI93_9MICO|nr:glucose-6-phosphate dehydrogenase [Homoserinimonas aerilata]TQL47813.1 glucose-6-phosphate 1-dehydrogenase [Homoserinimonas aerilata]
MTVKIDVLVVLGAGGDLTSRLLLPGLGQLLASGQADGLTLIGVGQDALSDDEWRERVTRSFESGAAEGAEPSRVAAQTAWLTADVTDAEGLRSVIAAVDGTPAFYFALPPAVAVAVVKTMAEIGVPEGTVLALEKPFGTDLASAQAFNALLARVVPENSVHRVDHFLGKSTVLNLIGLRFANRFFEQSWNRDAIERVDIVFDENLALEGRAGYYDHAGALVDMIQSHLLQVLALVAMEPPSTLDPDDLRGSIAQVLRAVRPQDDDPRRSSRRARYTPGTIGGRRLPSYADEKGVDPENGTETLAEMTVTVDNWRWAGVPFTLRSGKALADRRKEIVVTFREVPHLPEGLSGRVGPSRLRLVLGPDRIEFDVAMNGEDDPFQLDQVTLSAEFGAGRLGPYGEVLSGILSSDPTLSLRADVVEQCWRIVEPVLAVWRNGDVPLEEYPAGSAGPAAWSAVPPKA